MVLLRNKYNNVVSDGLLERLQYVYDFHVTRIDNALYAPKFTESDINKYFNSIKNANINVLKSFINKGIDINLVNENGSNILHLACLYGTIEHVKVILRFGINNIDTLNEKNNAPIHYAAFRQRYDMINLLLDHGSNPNILNCDSDTVLNILVEIPINNQVEVKKLIYNGAKINLDNFRDQRAVANLYPNLYSNLMDSAL
jgi:ankyrin repeat protein